MKTTSMFLTASVLIAMSGPADALQWFSGRVTSIEATYMPARIPFRLSEGNTDCPIGKALNWANPSVDNNKAIYAALMTSLTTGKRINFVIEDNDVTCTGRFIYLED
ncbi:hypothetical protein [Xanthomonas arboricola]|uniref:hypothetical protein n=1 Tax=Xanthomonas arboricola TaxID=56448 RepID=UPI001EE7F799|nr:hypothetical protein [Xanthomonas arboricola]